MRAGWQSKRLGDVCELDKAQGIYRDLPYVGLEDIESNTGRFIGSDEPRSVKSATFRFSREHVLYGRLRPYLNKVLTPDFEGHCSTEIFPVRPRQGLLREYLAYWLLSDETMARIDATSTGARMPRANMNAVLEFEFPLPPLQDQHRIVRTLDEAFDGIAKAKANAEKNVQNARAVFESHLIEVFTRRGGGWEVSSLGEIADFKNGLNYTRQSKGQTLPVVGVGDFKDNEIVPLASLQTATIDGELPSDYALRPGDLVTVRSNGSKDLVGRCMLVPELSGEVSYSGFVIRIRPDKQRVLPRYLLHFMRSGDTRERLASGGGGANISNINQTKLAALPIPLPTLQEQEQIADSLESLSEDTQRLVSVYEQKLAALESLKRSLLHHAFTGQL